MTFWYYKQARGSCHPSSPGWVNGQPGLNPTEPSFKFSVYKTNKTVSGLKALGHRLNYTFKDSTQYLNTNSYGKDVSMGTLRSYICNGCARKLHYTFSSLSSSYQTQVQHGQVQAFFIDLHLLWQDTARIHSEPVALPNQVLSLSRIYFTYPSNYPTNIGGDLITTTYLVSSDAARRTRAPVQRERIGHSSPLSAQLELILVFNACLSRTLHSRISLKALKEKIHAYIPT